MDHASVYCMRIVYSEKALFFMFGNAQNYKNVMVGLTYKEFSNQFVPDRMWKLYLIKIYFISLPLISQLRNALKMLERT